MAGPVRNEHIRWEDLHMGIALLAAERCKNRAHKSGACIVKPEGLMSENAGQVVGVGYRGRLVGPQEELHTRTPAEMNAIAFKATEDLSGCTMYITKFPSDDGSKEIVRSGIKKVIYLGKITSNEVEERFRRSGVEYRQFKVRPPITLDFE